MECIHTNTPLVSTLTHSLLHKAYSKTHLPTYQNKYIQTDTFQFVIIVRLKNSYWKTQNKTLFFISLLVINFMKHLKQNYILLSTSSYKLLFVIHTFNDITTP